jgi:hypothetical protein
MKLQPFCVDEARRRAVSRLPGLALGWLRQLLLLRFAGLVRVMGSTVSHCVLVLPKKHG